MLPGLPNPDVLSGGAEAAGESAIIPDEIPVWADGFDDNSKVYIPPGGLVGVEVLGGAVQLLPGSIGGWVASELITCPEDYRYDLVILKVDTPGDSYVEVSILDATEESSVVGFANATIPNFIKVKSTDVSVYTIAPAS